MLVTIALVLNVVPYIMIIGFIIAVVGVVMVVLGRDSFPGGHSSLVMRSIILYVFGFVIVFVAAFVFGFSVAQDVVGGGTRAMQTQSIIDGFNGLLIAGLVGALMIGVSYVLFTFGLQDESGRLLLYLAFVANVASSIFSAYVISGQVATAASQSFANGSFDLAPITALRSQLQYLQLLGLIPAGLFALTYYRIYHEISIGNIPQRTTPIGPTPPI